MKVLVCGGRDFDNWKAVYRALTDLHARRPIGCLIEGGARGADFLGGRWARCNRIATMKFEANWYGYGKRAGPIRNGWMLEYGKPDLVVAFPGGGGTVNMIEQAHNVGVEVWQPLLVPTGDPQ